MKIPLFYIDAFTSEVFKGNQAAVCLLESWLPDDVLQSIAAEHNLSETAFVVREEKELFQLKWFTPKMEVDLCGHATLAASHVVFSIYSFGNKSIRFKTKSGILTATHSQDGKITLDFPSFEVKPFTGAINDVSEALGMKIKEIYQSRDILVVCENEKDVIDLAPNFPLLKKLDCMGIVVTAPGHDCDFVSRYFAPAAGIDEDPVTGSAHSLLAPFWSTRLKKSGFFARQLSSRTGELWCEVKGDRVLLSGYAIAYMQGTINIKITPSSVLIPFTMG
jgi:PhzF family phenazine biosynthesis protein